MNFNKLNERETEILELVLKVQNADYDAFSKLYDIFIDPIYKYVYYRVNQNDAEDVVENVFLKVWENIRKYKIRKNKSFSSWVFKIAHNTIIDYYRGSKDRDFDELTETLPDDSREHNPIKGAERSFNHIVLKKAMNHIKEKYRDIIIYKFINDFSNEEIAKILGKSEGSIRILQHRALRILKFELEKWGVNYSP